MGWAFDHPFAWVGLSACAFAWTLAAFVYLHGPTRPQNRRLGLVLFFEGVAVGAGTGLMYMMTERGDSYAFQAVAVIATLVLPILYLWFLTTLDAPLVRSLQRPGPQILIPVLAAGVTMLWFLRPEMFIAGMEPTWYAEWDSSSGPWGSWRLWISIAIYVFGLFVAVSAYRQAPPGSVARNRALAYVVAFGTRDLLLVTIYVLRQTLPGGPAKDVFSILSRPFVTLLFVALVSYGILKTHLFDLDVRVKWTISRGTVAALILGGFYVVSELSARVFQQRFGALWGIIAAGLLLFALSPLQRFGHKIANAAMPDVVPIGLRTKAERLDLYRHQLEIAWMDGRLTRKEALLLDTFRSRLGLSPEEAAGLQHSLAAAVPARLGRGVHRPS